jgi:hypothetical protein
VQDAVDAWNEAAQAAVDAYNAAAQRATDTFNQAAQQAAQTYNAAEQAAVDAYNAAVQRATDTYNQAIEDADGQWNQAAEAAWNQYVTAITSAVGAWNQAAQNAEAARQAEIAPALAAWRATEASAWAQRQRVVADAQADYDHALAGLQDQANAAWDEYAQAMEAAGCTPAGGPRQLVAPMTTAADGSQQKGDRRGSGTWFLDGLQGLLDVVGVFDPTPICDGINGTISWCRGNKFDAAASYAAMLPYFGDVGKLAKYGRKAANALDAAADAARTVDKTADAARAARAATGQLHHAISTKVHRALENHPNLRGAYQLRDPRLVTRAADKQAHYSYQRWHRELDEEVVRWLQSPKNKEATVEDFEKFLRSLYDQPEMRKRFPEGLPQ